MNTNEQQTETYLGDGLYASFDGYQIVLRAPRAQGDHYVALEPKVWEALVLFAESLRAKPPVEKEYHSDEPEERV